MHQSVLKIKTQGRGIKDITANINAVIQPFSLHMGICHLFLQHTSASLIICENADPKVRNDLEHFMQRLVPDGDQSFTHTEEGIDDMSGHIRTILTNASLVVPIRDQQLLLGHWQGIFLWEHRFQHHERKIIVSAW